MSKLEDEIGHVDINDRTIQRIVNEMEKKGFLKDELKKKFMCKYREYQENIMNKWI